MSENKTIKLQLLKRINLDYRSINHLISLDNELQKMMLTNIEIDITKTSFFEASLCSIFSAILRRSIEKNGLNISFRHNNNNVMKLLNKNGFFGKVQDVNGTIIPLKKFDKNENENFLKYVSEHLKAETNKFPFTKDIADEIRINLGEIFSNCEIHTQTKQVYTCGQLFPNVHEFSFSLTDTGEGIPNLVSQKKGIEDPIEAIKWALDKGNTTKTDNIGGLGLKRLKDSILKRNGTLIIISNNVYYDAINDLAEKFSFDFEGTCVIIKLQYS
ncbi:MAG: hypothetical protein PHE89_02775 [Alphaproteobacteria bacterium]|nr:hypothetical protein [Alphaproteobacteria bacterium]